jgi:hypothetical protein
LMAVITVGGHSRKVGKSSVVAGVINAFSNYPWTAIKISSHWHGDSSAAGPFDIYEERDRAGNSDTCRFLAAGASRALWVRVKENSFESAMPKLLPIIQSSPFAIVESNRILKYLQPDLSVFVLRYDVRDFKDSARDILSMAHAIIAVNYGKLPQSWKGIRAEVLERIPLFKSENPKILPAAFVNFIRSRLFPAADQ